MPYIVARVLIPTNPIYLGKALEGEENGMRVESQPSVQRQESDGMCTCGVVFLRSCESLNKTIKLS